MNTRAFTTADAAYPASLELRNRLLRIPLGLDLTDEDLSDEVNQTHYGLFDGDRLLACVILKDAGGGVAKLRQMVVEEGYRGAGLGRRLIRDMEALAAAAGVRRITMAARTIARGFYEKLGYRAEGGVFQEVGIEHIKMTKQLSP